MDIISVELNAFSGSGLNSDCEGMLHVKSLPCLSVVQALEGSYDISLNGMRAASTGEGGMFIAPAEALQRITHHNGKRGMMRARWAFLEITLNRYYLFDDLFEFPVLMPADQCAAAGDMIATICSDVPICERYAAAYRLAGILMDVGKPRQAPDETLLHIRSFVAERFADRIGAKDIAAQIHCSPSQVYRYTQKYFGMTPSSYINSVRLRRAAELLELTDRRIGEIAAAAGFEDISYFTRLFRRAFGMAPGSYRRFGRPV